MFGSASAYLTPVEIERCDKKGANSAKCHAEHRKAQYILDLEYRDALRQFYVSFG